MRLIDVATLLKKIKEISHYDDYDVLVVDWDDMITCIDVDEAPTIEAEPVRHGRLLSTDAYPHRLYCSECYKTLIPNEEICFEKNEFPKYCMWCGAKMDEVNDETN